MFTCPCTPSIESSSETQIVFAKEIEITRLFIMLHSVFLNLVISAEHDIFRMNGIFIPEVTSEYISVWI